MCEKGRCNIPIFEYECKQCGMVIEMYHPYPKNHRVCPGCQGNMKRIMSKTTFVLKGGSWGEDGYTTRPEPAKKEDNNEKP